MDRRRGQKLFKSPPRLYVHLYASVRLTLQKKLFFHIKALRSIFSNSVLARVKLESCSPWIDGLPHILPLHFQGGVICLRQQIRNFDTVTLPELRARLGGNNQRLSSHLSKSLFVIGTGGNDYMLNYFLPGGPTQKINVQDFTRILIAKLSKQLKVRDHHRKVVSVRGVNRAGRPRPSTA